MKKTYKRPYDIDSLRELYLTQNMSARQIAERFNLPLSVIEGDLCRYEIRKPAALRIFSQGCKKWIDKEELYEFYIIQNHSTEEAAEHFHVHERTIRRNLKVFGIKKSMQAQRLLRNQVMQQKYGTPEIQNSEYYRKNILSKMLKKMKQTNLKKYGVEYTAQVPEVKNSIKQTCLKKYGYENPNQSPEQRHKGFSRYYYQGLKFDSGWELALWIYAKEHNENIEREPIQLEYEHAGRIHYYFPDFRYKEELVEIKGSHLINKKGVLTNRCQKTTNGLLLAKTKCMHEHGVKILGQKEIQFALNYVRCKYGNDYLKSFKCFKKDLRKKESEER